MTTWNPDMLTRYKQWHWDQVRTGDLDPVYPWLRAYIPLTGANPQQAAALTLTYLVYYRVDSAVQAWEQANRHIPLNPSKHPTGTERRAHRDPTQLHKHLTSLHEHTAGDPHGWLTNAPTWEAMTERVMTVHGNGRWAAYKACDLAVNVHDAPWTAPDAGHANSTGPRKALNILTGQTMPTDNHPDTIHHLNTITLQLAEIVGDPDVSRIETSLCDFRSHIQGRHPLGHDVQALAHQIRHLPHGPKAFRQAQLTTT